MSKISVIIPVYKEKSLGLLVQQIQSLASPEELEMIVCDGESNGSSIRVIKDKRVMTLTASKGRGRQMNAGAKMATGDILVFLHADTILPKVAFQKIKECMREGTQVLGAFKVEMDADSLLLKLISKATTWRSQLTKTPYGDQAFFISRKNFELEKGFMEIPLLEDVEFVRRLKKRNYKVRIVDAVALTSARRWKRVGLFKCTLINRWITFLYWLGVSPEKLAKLYK